MKEMKEYLDLLVEEKAEKLACSKDFVSYVVRYNDEDEMFSVLIYNMSEAEALDMLPKNPAVIVVDGKREE